MQEWWNGNSEFSYTNTARGWRDKVWHWSLLCSDLGAHTNSSLVWCENLCRWLLWWVFHPSAQKQRGLFFEVNKLTKRRPLTRREHCSQLQRLLGRIHTTVNASTKHISLKQAFPWTVWAWLPMWIKVKQNKKRQACIVRLKSMKNQVRKPDMVCRLFKRIG